MINRDDEGGDHKGKMVKDQPSDHKLSSAHGNNITVQILPITSSTLETCSQLIYFTY